MAGILCLWGTVGFLHYLVGATTKMTEWAGITEEQLQQILLSLLGGAFAWLATWWVIQDIE